MTWLHSNGKDKYEYQMKHFGHCGYKWNYETNQLELNLEFYAKNKIDIPKIINE
jgi:ribosomal protein L6P/L9E